MYTYTPPETNSKSPRKIGPKPQRKWESSSSPIGIFRGDGAKKVSCVEGIGLIGNSQVKVREVPNKFCLPHLIFFVWVSEEFQVQQTLKRKIKCLNWWPKILGYILNGKILDVIEQTWMNYMLKKWYQCIDRLCLKMSFRNGFWTWSFLGLHSLCGKCFESPQSRRRESQNLCRWKVLLLLI